MDIEPRLLRVFVTVLRCGSVTRAAIELNTTQPSVSKALKRLETLVGFRLFEPRGRGIHPTKEAQILREDALRVERELEAVRHRIIQIRQSRQRGIRIAAIPAMTTVLLPRAIAEFTKSHRAVSVEVETWRREKILFEFDAGRVDIAIIYSASQSVPSGFNIVANAPLRCLMPEGHRLTSKPLITVDDLKSENLVIYHHSLELADTLWRLLENVSPMPNIVVEASQGAFLRDLVRDGVGISVIDGFTANNAAEKDMVSRPFHPTLPFYVAIADHGPKLSSDAKHFLSILQRVAMEEATISS